MSAWLVGIGIPVVVWWGTTGIVLYAVRRPRATYGMTVCIASSLAALAAVAVLSLRDVTGPAAAVAGYVAAIALWGWLEVTYLTGRITGPHRVACETGASRGERFSAGVRTSLHHELLVIGLGVLLAWSLAGAANRVAADTFLVLWAMRWSAKLNLFHGVPNLNEEFFPAHLEYLKSYMAKRRFNALFPVTVGAATIAFVALAQAAGARGLDADVRVPLLMVATTLGLAIAEHWFLVLPVPDERLWRWAEPRGRRKGRDGGIEPLGAAGLIRQGSEPARQL